MTSSLAVYGIAGASSLSPSSPALSPSLSLSLSLFSLFSSMVALLPLQAAGACTGSLMLTPVNRSSLLPVRVPNHAHAHLQSTPWRGILLLPWQLGLQVSVTPGGGIHQGTWWWQ